MILRLQRRFLSDYIKKREDFLTLFAIIFCVGMYGGTR